ncbi:hypothetical protein L1987_66965 [Smallanthus sonchifolius]|uniref:Uncharacterized protein n=1 Tax=Smallanthus sonchifolius TaxID=185202 RepID=A0ACB9BYY1_9ASTR|nr:hypothetical protein L1987_66965 [Smallanthus sonchifolius]
MHFFYVYWLTHCVEPVGYGGTRYSEFDRWNSDDGRDNVGSGQDGLETRGGGPIATMKAVDLNSIVSKVATHRKRSQVKGGCDILSRVHFFNLSITASTV